MRKPIRTEQKAYSQRIYGSIGTEGKKSRSQEAKNSRIGRRRPQAPRLLEFLSSWLLDGLRLSSAATEKLHANLCPQRNRSGRKTYPNAPERSSEVGQARRRD